MLCQSNWQFEMSAATLQDDVEEAGDFLETLNAVPDPDVDFVRVANL